MTEPSIFIWKNVFDGGLVVAFALDEEEAIDVVLKEYTEYLETLFNKKTRTGREGIKESLDHLRKKLEETKCEEHGVYDGPFAEYSEPIYGDDL